MSWGASNTDKIQGHEFVAVVSRRWCLCCELYQQKKGADWPALTDCPRDTPFARGRDEGREPA